MRASHLLRARPVLATLGSFAALAIAAPAANASHLMGGHLSASISAADELSVNVHWMQRDAGCVVGTTTWSAPLTITAPGGAARSSNEQLKATRCQGSTAIFDGTVRIDLRDTTDGFGPTPPSGTYTIEASECCRVGGIMNAGSSSGVSLEATVRRVPGQATASPRYIGATAAGASQGFLYTGDVTAVDADEPGALTYGLLQSSDPAAPFHDSLAPATNVVSLSGSTVSVPAATTAGWTLGSYFAFKTDAASATEHTLLDMLVKVTSNRPPAFDTVPETFEVTAGQELILPLKASDPDNVAPKVDTVTISANALPSWASFTTTNGNPATAKLVFAPPVGVEGTFLLPIDAADDDADAFLQDTRIVRVKVVAPRPAEQPAPAPAVEQPRPAEQPAPVVPQPTPPAPPRLSVARVDTGDDGVATVSLDVPGPGRLDLTGDAYVNRNGRGARGGGYLIVGTSASRKPLRLFARTKVVQTGGRLKVDFRLQRKSLRDLARRGLLRVTFRARFTPGDGGPVLKASKSLRLKAFTLMLIGKPKLVSDGHRMLLTVRAPRAGRLWARVSAAHDGGTVLLGRTKAAAVRRGEAVLSLPVDTDEARHVLSATVVPIRITAVLDRAGKRQTRTRGFELRP